MRSMMESFERWSINGEPDAPRDASPVPREDCRNLCSKGIRRCFPTLLHRRILLFLVGGQYGQQSPNAGDTQRSVSGQPGLRGDAADVRQWRMGRVSRISCGDAYAGSDCQRRHGSAQRQGRAFQSRHFLRRVAPQQRNGRADLPRSGMMR